MVRIPRIVAFVLAALSGFPLMRIGTCSVAESAAGDLKAPCRGLMIRDCNAKPPMPFLDSVVVQVRWAELETADQRFDGPGWEKIERIRALGLKIRLRIFAGVHAPAFVKKIGGPGISDPQRGTDASGGGIAVWNQWDQRGGTIPRFWLPEVLDQYEELMTEVARRYENEPEIREVVNSGCMTLYAEPFYRAHRDTGTNRRLYEAGLTFEKDLAAHRRTILIHDRLFVRTRTSLAINSWDIIDDSPLHHRASFAPTHEFVTWARNRMGERLVLQNNGTGVDAAWPAAATVKTNHFCFLNSAGGPKGFQTRTLGRLGGTSEGLYKALDRALAMGANFVELPQGFQQFDAHRLREYDQQFEETPLEVQHDTVADRIDGTWVLQQVSSCEELDRLASKTIGPGLRTPRIRGFCLRVPWHAIDEDFSLLEAGLALARSHNVDYSIRFMAGRHTPKRIFERGCPFYEKKDHHERTEKIPAPFDADGSPNVVFEAEYDALVERLGAWCRENDVHLLHLAWYGQDWAELNHGKEVRAAAGYSYEAWLAAHKRLIDIGLKHAGRGLAVELPFSGYGPLTDAALEFADHVIEKCGPDCQVFYCQANGWAPGGDWGAPTAATEAAFDKVWARPIRRGQQAIQPDDFDWRTMYANLRENRSTYCEVYASSFLGPRRDELAQEILSFAHRQP